MKLWDIVKWDNSVKFPGLFKSLNQTNKNDFRMLVTEKSVHLQKQILMDWVYEKN